jgi:glycosyltransferase involved in cell wall biosynthesis
MGDNYPLVSIIMPVHNEQHYIAACLDSILANDYAKTKIEILVIDGMSTDNTRNIVLNYSIKFPFIRLIDNSKIIQVAALNIGIHEAKGKIIMRMDAHAIYAPDFISKCVDLLLTSSASNVGGVLTPIGAKYTSQAIAIASTSVFGAGDAYFRWADKIKQNMWVDTVFPGCWLKSTLEKFDGFNEEFVINEDYELNYRIRRAGGKILLSPELRCQYHVRPYLKPLSKQYFRYGFWKAKTISLYHASMRWRQLAPPILVIGFLVSLYMIMKHQYLGYVIPVSYLSADIVASILSAHKKGWKYLPLLLIIFPTLHLSWGSGFLVGLFRWGGALLKRK